jgi:dTDP-4-amino-4,6-dideoxygalactose transaminase
MTARKVPLLDLTRLDEAQLRELRDAFDRVLRSGQYVMGPEVDAFERECEAFLGCRHAIGVSSGTDALILAMMALGVGAGDEVICPTYTFFASPGAIWRLGARPVFVDVDPATYNCAAPQIAAALTPRTKAIMPVHLFGQCADMAAITSLAAEAGVPVIEDAAQAFGARYRGAGAGTIGAFGCFSFFPSKNLGCLGDSGLLTTGDDQLAERARVMRVHGGKPKYHHQVVGGNFRIDALQCALLRAKLPRLPAATAARRRNAALYREQFVATGIVGSPTAPEPGAIGLPEIGNDHIVNQYVIRIGGGRRDAVRQSLQEQGVGTEVYYPVPMHLQPCFGDLGHRAGEFPHAERAAQETLALPVFPELTADEIRHVVGAVTAACRSRSVD